MLASTTVAASAPSAGFPTAAPAAKRARTDFQPPAKSEQQLKVADELAGIARKGGLAVGFRPDDLVNTDFCDFLSKFLKGYLICRCDGEDRARVSRPIPQPKIKTRRVTDEVTGEKTEVNVTRFNPQTGEHEPVREIGAWGWGFIAGCRNSQFDPVTKKESGGCSVLRADGSVDTWRIYLHNTRDNGLTNLRPFMRMVGLGFVMNDHDEMIGGEYIGPHAHIPLGRIYPWPSTFNPDTYRDDVQRRMRIALGEDPNNTTILFTTMRDFVHEWTRRLPGA